MTRRRVDVIVSVALVAVVVAAVAWPIATGQLGPKAYDHRMFHLPLVREWAATWPVVDLHDYNSATGPLYHWLMAGAAQVVGVAGGPETAPALQFTNALFGGLVVVLVYRFARTLLSPLSAFLAGLALACSPYLLGNAIWMMTDNLSLALVVATIGLATFSPWTATRAWQSGVVAALSISTRQINLWLLGPIAMATLVRSRCDRRTIAATVAATALVVATLATFVVLWGGLVPPRFRGAHTGGVQPAVIGYALTLVAAYGVCVLPAAPNGLRTLRARPGFVLVVLALGALVAAIGASYVDIEAGRNGGWVWRSAARFPVIAGRSTFIVAGGALGSLVLSALVIEAKRAARMNEAVVLVTAFAGFLVAHVANAQVYQRYYDPMVLLTLVWLVALVTPRDEPPRRATTWGLAILVVQQACFAVGVLYAPMFAARPA
ncbi:MAG: glycosyltransferase family 39 protein [Phycisphaerales bacterium]